MKIIAYSQVPAKHTYIHLAYLSAAAENEAVGYATTGLFFTFLYLLVLVWAKATKLPTTFPRTWRMISVVFVALILGFLLLGFLGPSLTRSR